MKQSTKRFLSLIISFFLFTAALVVYFSYIVPANQEIQTIKSRYVGRQNFIENQKSAISQVQKLVESYQGQGQIQDVISSIIPQSVDTAGAFAQMSGLTQVNKLIIQGLSVSVPVQQNASASSTLGGVLVKPLGSLDFQVRIVGTYEDFKSFLGNLETNIRIFDIKRIDIQPMGKPNQDLYSFDITATTYYQVE